MLLGEGALDLVDDRQLLGPRVGLGQQPLRLVEQSSVLQRHAHARRDRRQQPLIGLVVGVGLGGLHGQHAHHALAAEDRHPDPRLALHGCVMAPGRVRVGFDRPEGVRLPTVC